MPIHPAEKKDERGETDAGEEARREESRKDAVMAEGMADSSVLGKGEDALL